MKKTLVIPTLMSVVFVFLVQSAMAGKEIAFLPVISFLLGEDGAVSTTTFADIHPMLVADCSSSCHDSGAGGYWVTSDLTLSYNSAFSRVDLGNPESSLLLYKPALLTNHGGGKIPLYGKDEAKYTAVLKWIEDGALRE